LKSSWNEIKYKVLDSMLYLGKPATSMAIAKWSGLTEIQVQNELSRWRRDFRNYIIARPRLSLRGHLYSTGWRGRVALFNMKEYHGMLSKRTGEMHPLPIERWDAELKAVREALHAEEKAKEEARIAEIIQRLKSQRGDDNKKRHL